MVSRQASYCVSRETASPEASRRREMKLWERQASVEDGERPVNIVLGAGLSNLRPLKQVSKNPQTQKTAAIDVYTVYRIYQTRHGTRSGGWLDTTHQHPVVEKKSRKKGDPADI